MRYILKYIWMNWYDIWNLLPNHTGLGRTWYILNIILFIRIKNLSMIFSYKNIFICLKFSVKKACLKFFKRGNISPWWNSGLVSLLWGPSIFSFHKPPADSENEKILGNTVLGDFFSNFRRLIQKAKYFSICNLFTCDFSV